MIVIVDYKMGNLLSIKNMLKKIGCESMVSSDSEVIKNASKLILPGVGSFTTAMKSINELNIKDALDFAVIERKIPIMGICLGMQLMCSQSEEGGQITRGLNWIKANVKRIPVDMGDEKLKIPHIGWTEIYEKQKSELFIKNDSNKFYFVHAYYVELMDKNDLLTTSNYGIEFCSSFKNGNILGVQFHPEKSHKFGLHLFEKFMSL